MKKANGRSATRVRLSLNPLIMSGIRGPITLVRNEITKKVSSMRLTI
jgi:hypothetical protein